MAGGVPRAQARRQQATGVTLEDKHRMIHVLPVAAVKEAELLLTIGGIVGGVEIEQDFAALADLVATEADELLAPSVVQAYQIASIGRVFPGLRVGCEKHRWHLRTRPRSDKYAAAVRRAHRDARDHPAADRANVQPIGWSDNGVDRRSARAKDRHRW